MDFRAAELRGFFRQDEVTGQSQFESSTQTLSADCRNGRRGCSRDLSQQGVKPGQSYRNLFWKMLLNAGPEAEVGTFASEHDGFKIPPCREVVEGRLQACHHRLIDNIGLGRVKNDASYLPVVFELEPRFVAAAHPCLPAATALAVHGAISAISSSLHGTPSASRCRSNTKSTSR